MDADLSNLEVMIQNLGESMGKEGQESLKTHLMGGNKRYRNCATGESLFYGVGSVFQGPLIGEPSMETMTAEVWECAKSEDVWRILRT